MYLLTHILKDAGEKFPEKDAVVLGNNFVTYAELERKSSQLASLLMNCGIKKGDRVGILLKKSIESIISIFGVMKAGAIYVPLDFLAPAKRSKYIIRNCGIECLITSSQGMSTLFSEEDEGLPLRKAIITELHKGEPFQQRLDVECITWTEVEQETPEYRQSDIADIHPAYILHTSGSTGTPKGVVISHLNALTFIDMANDFFKIRGNDRFASHAPLHFDLSVFDIFCAMKAGASLVLVPEYLSTFPAKLAELIEQERITIWNSVSSLLTLLADKGRLDRFGYESLRLVHFSGDVMLPKYLRVLKAQMSNAEFYNIYGQTEANSSLYYRVEEIPDNDAWKIPIGRPFPNFEVIALNDRNEPIAHADEEGELLIKSSTVALGYWGDAEKTADRFMQEPGNPQFRSTVYRTGDVVRVDGEGNFLFVGRKDHMIKSRGYRIELGEIELVMGSHPKVNQAVVVPIPDELIGNRIIAYAGKSEGETIDGHELIEYCGGLLPKYMVPERIEVLDMLPKTSNGKIDRKSIEKEAMVKYLGR